MFNMVKQKCPLNKQTPQLKQSKKEYMYVIKTTLFGLMGYIRLKLYLSDTVIHASRIHQGEVVVVAGSVADPDPVILGHPDPDPGKYRIRILYLQKDPSN